MDWLAWSARDKALVANCCLVCRLSKLDLIEADKLILSLIFSLVYKKANFTPHIYNTFLTFYLYIVMLVYGLCIDFRVGDVLKSQKTAKIS